MLVWPPDCNIMAGPAMTRVNVNLFPLCKRPSLFLREAELRDCKMVNETEAVNVSFLVNSCSLKF